MRELIFFNLSATSWLLQGGARKGYKRMTISAADHNMHVDKHEYEHDGNATSVKYVNLEM